MLAPYGRTLKPNAGNDHPSLEAYKARLDGALEQPGSEGGVPSYNRELELRDRKGPFRPTPLYDSIALGSSHAAANAEAKL